MKKEVLAYIKQNKMIKKKDMILAGVSGGSGFFTEGCSRTSWNTWTRS